MKSYPSISKDIILNENVYIFDKIDGSNIRAEWSKKKGFYKFGTKKCLIDENTPIFGKSIALIKQSYENQLSYVFKKERIVDNVVCFFEFVGSNSFAGWHDEKDFF